VIKVEKSSLDDLYDIYEIEKSVFNNYWSELSLRKELENKNFNLNLVCRLNNKIIGYFFSKHVKNEYHILNFALKKNYQHRGYGKNFFNIILKEYILDGSVFLEVKRSNLSAINFYKKFNFKEIGFEKKYYSDGEDAIKMRLYKKKNELV
tara:strand:- start:1909 stop:2358 length:450 start_codon:yes stop_codon:yes gene_type:complete